MGIKKWSDVEKGNIRESFFAGQVGERHPVYSSTGTDFLVVIDRRRFAVEVGARSKTKKKTKQLNNALVFKDGIEMGAGKSIPSYLAGFLY